MILGAYASHAQIAVTDLAGRQVVLEAPARRIVLATPSDYSALSIVSREAAAIVVGVGGTPNDNLSETYGDLSKTPRLGWTSTSTFSIEAALALRPDLLIAHLNRGGQQPAVEAAFAKAGVPVIYVDFANDPASNIEPSMAIIGKALGEERRAAEFIDFHRERVARIADRLKAARPARPKLMLVPRRGDDACCWAWQGWGILKYFDMLRASNVSDSKMSGVVGKLALEYVIESDPDIIVYTDYSSHPASLFGMPRTAAHAVASLERLSAAPGLRDLSAMRSRRVHAMDTYLMMYSPLNVLALERLAKWIHPDLFPDLDPQATLEEINRRFLSTPQKGPLWASLDPAADRPADRRP